jgi:hypothetical protein
LIHSRGNRLRCARTGRIFRLNTRALVLEIATDMPWAWQDLDRKHA